MARFIEGPPQTTERVPHAAHPRIEGTKVASRARSGERFKEFPITAGELSLLIEPNAVDFFAPPLGTIETLADNAVLLRDMTDREEAIRKAASDAKAEREDVRDGEIAPAIKEIPDLRGLFSVSRDVELTATPTHGAVTFDINKLRKSARTERRFRKLTSRRVIVEFTPRKDMDPEAVRAIVEEGLDSLGSRVARKASVITTWIVDDEAVAGMVNSGEITLLPETRRVEEGVSYKAVHLPKRRKNIKTRKPS
jgi:hypothetical protein